ncbi:MAG: hypothetical protein U0795_06040 [Pirellulales bacterium]
MFILDKALQERANANNPIRVALVGAGYAGRGIAHQLLTPLTGIRLVAICNRTTERAERIFAEKQCEPSRRVTTAKQLDEAVEEGIPAVTDDFHIICDADSIDIVIDATGQVEYGARLALAVLAGRKHLILVNAELDATVGPLLKRYADDAGVVLTNTDGDEPGVANKLYRFVKTIGCRPVMAGNIKGFVDVHRNPDTQRAFAAQVGQDPTMITSFADGTKLSMECTILANATGLTVGQSGMFGHKCEHVKDVIQHFSPEELLARPLVDYALGAQPGTGAFVVGYNDEPLKMEYMRYFKMGDGPLYVFYTPFHLPHLEIAITIGRAVLFSDAAVAAIDGPVADVVAVAKRPLRAGDLLDGIGGFTCYGRIENYSDSRSQNALPMGLSAGCRVIRDVPADAMLTYDDVEFPEDLTSLALRRELESIFVPDAAAATAS